MKQPIDLVLIGAGQRGALAYGSYALARPEDARIVAVAEPDPERRKRVADQHDIDDDMCFADWRELTSRSQLARGAIIATQDQDHVPPAVAAMQAGYDVLLEKPMAHTLAGCVQLVQTAEHTGRILQVCHVLRYSPFWRALHEVLEFGRLGDIITVEHRENVAFWHMAHSFVRGNWRNAALSSPMILAKCCHDLDILVWNLSSPVQRLSSFGSLRHFRPENAGPEIPDRCTDGCPVEQKLPVFCHRHLPRLSHPAAGDSPAVREGHGCRQPTVLASFRSLGREHTCRPPRRATIRPLWPLRLSLRQ